MPESPVSTPETYFPGRPADFGGRTESQLTERTLLFDPEWSPKRKYLQEAGSVNERDGSLTLSSHTAANCCPSQAIDEDDNTNGRLDDGTRFYSTSRKSRPSESKFRAPHFEEVSLTLQNSGSVARDHLASERTFLAYMRTSLTIASAGIALVQLFSNSHADSGNHLDRLPFYIRMLGAGAIILGLLVLVIGVTRYFTIQAALVKGLFPVARLATATIALLLTMLVTMTFGMLLTGRLDARR